MSFTADELQAFNDIFDKKLSAHRRDMEHFFEQRLNAFRREVEQRLVAVQQETIRVLTQKLAELQSKMHTILHQQLTDQQMHITQSVNQAVRQRQEQPVSGTDHIEGIVDRSLAAQLLAIEELLNQRLAFQSLDEVSFPMATAAMVTSGEYGPQFEAIEVQTDLPWEDLMEVFGKVLDDRFATLGDRAQIATQQLEHQLSARISALQHQLFDELSHLQVHSYGGNAPNPTNLTNMQEVFLSIEQLERIIESMQVAMTANHALLSNRLFHHQQLPLERAHPTHLSHASNSDPVQSPNGMSNSLLRPTKEEQNERTTK